MNNIALLIEILRLASAVLEVRMGDKVTTATDEAVALARIAAAAQQAYLNLTGKPLDEYTIKPQEPIQ